MQPIPPLLASALIEEIRGAGIRFIVALPDRTTSKHLLRGLLDDPSFTVVQVCKEDEGLSICSGLHATGQRALLLMQYTGLLDSINALYGVAVEGENPVCMMVGLMGKEPGVPPTQSGRYGLRIVEPILDVMGVAHDLIEAPEDVARVPMAVDAAYASAAPVVLLIGGEPQ